MIGEQPGDKEDLTGEPFVGPAGHLLDDALGLAGIDREKVFVTNAVKHFSFEERGKRRIHKKPLSSQIQACRPWLETEIALIEPRVIVCLGVSAAQSLFGSGARLGDLRGSIQQHPLYGNTLVTVHPSAILRAIDPAERESQFAQFVADLAIIHDVV
jgi:DNA polymerase